MENWNEMIIEPLITEKSSFLSEKGKYLFQVQLNANKPMLVKALESLFSVKVAKINTVVQKGKKRKVVKKGVFSYAPRRKKIMVSLKEGFFPFMESMK